MTQEIENLIKPFLNTKIYLETYGFNLDICLYRNITHLHAQIFFNILNGTSLDYYVFAGTSIGYIRNKENIPWVDDYDIMIFEDNIEYFKNKILPILSIYGFTLKNFNNAGFQIFSAYGSKIFQCDVFYTRITNSRYKKILFYKQMKKLKKPRFFLKNSFIENFNGWGLYDSKYITIDIVKPKKYLTIDGDLTIPFFNKIEEDLNIEYGDVTNICKIHINHKNKLTINAHYTEVYQVFNKLKNNIIDNMKKKFDNHAYISNLTLTDYKDNLYTNLYDKHIQLLKYIKKKNLKVLSLIDEKYLIYCPDIKFYFPHIIINFYMTKLLQDKNLILLNYVDSIFCSTQKLIDNLNNYTSLFYYYNKLKSLLLSKNISLNAEFSKKFSKPNIKLIRVITFGTFDLFHQGHFNILKKASNFGTLIVGVSTDKLNIKKGKISINNLQKRKTDVLNTKFTEIVFDEEDLSLKNSYVIKYNCNLLIMGDDWKDKFDFCDCACIYLPRTPNISTTLLKSQLK
jgi:glycerol-3-phosphate cytidylyltransferase